MTDRELDASEYNRHAWDQLAASGNQWTIPVSDAIIEQARSGNWAIVLTPAKPVPRDWFGDLKGASVLCLASGGGQQGPVLAAAGASVTVFDNSPAQLHQDRSVADRHNLNIKTVLGDMRDLSDFADEVFDLIVHPCSNGFVPDIRPVWRESFRVLKPGGRLMTGFINPLYFLFDYFEMKAGRLVVRHSIPYSDARDLSPEELQTLKDQNEPLMFGHTLEDQIGGQLEAGFEMIGFFEDGWDDADAAALTKYIQSFIGTLVQKPT